MKNKNLITGFFLLLTIFFASTIRAQETIKKKELPGLVQTYQRELAFLLAQKNSLTNQIKKVGLEYNSNIKKAKLKNEVLQGNLVNLTAENETLGLQISTLEQELENAAGNNSLIETILTQARVGLDLESTAFDRFEMDENKLYFAFNLAWEKMKDARVESTRPFEFYLNNGIKVKGEMRKIGNIASYGFYLDNAGLLVPVGEGKLKLTNTELAPQIKAVVNNTAKIMPLFLYESTSTGIGEKKEKTLVDTMEAGGAIAYVIVGLGIVALILIIIRSVILFKSSKVDKNSLKEIQKGNFETMVDKIDSLKGPLGRVLKRTLDSLDLDKDKRENIIQESILGELSLLDKFGTLILVMAAVSPLLGLLGTVTGMISTFDIITEFGTGDPKLLSSGISEALITTELGLVVAIPALMMGNILGSWSNKLKLLLETEALRLSNLGEARNK